MSTAICRMGWWSHESFPATDFRGSGGTGIHEGAKEPFRKHRPVPPPFSLRQNANERAQLERDAAGLTLGTCIKGRLFDESAPIVRRRASAPVKDHAALAQVLGMLGAMRLANNLNHGVMRWTGAAPVVRLSSAKDACVDGLMRRF